MTAILNKLHYKMLSVHVPVHILIILPGGGGGGGGHTDASVAAQSPVVTIETQCITPSERCDFL